MRDAFAHESRASHEGDWSLADRLRSTGMNSASAYEQFLSALSAFVALSYLDLWAKEEEAIDLFEGRTESIHHNALSNAWSKIVTMDVHHLRPFLDQLWQELAGSDVPQFSIEILRRGFHPSNTDFAILKAAIDTVGSVRLEHPQQRSRLASTLEFFIEQWLKQSPASGEFVTPQGLSKLIADVASPKVGERIYDPCAGLGGLLVAVSNHIGTQSRTLPPAEAQKLTENSLFGIEIRAQLALIAWARLMLADVTLPRIELGNALERPIPQDRSKDGFDCVIANPPFGGRSDPALVSNFVVPSTSMHVLFIQHILRSLRPGGRAICVVPEGFLFRNGADGRVREILLNDYCVDAVISLPPGAFQPYSAIKTSLLLLSQRPPQSHILFVSSHCALAALKDDPGGAIVRQALAALIDSRRGDHDRTEIIDLANRLANDSNKKTDVHRDAYREAASLLALIPSVQKNCKSLSHVTTDRFERAAWLIETEKLRDNRFDLHISESRGDDVLAFLDTFATVRPNSRVVILNDVAQVYRGVNYTGDRLVEQNGNTVPFVRVQDVTSSGKESGSRHLKRPKQHVHRELISENQSERFLRINDIVVTAGGTVGVCAIVGEESAGSIPSDGIMVIRLMADDIPPPFLMRLLMTQPYQSWFKNHATGNTIKHLSIKSLRQLAVLAPPRDEATALSRRLLGGESGLAVIELLQRSTTRSYWAKLLEDDVSLNDLVSGVEENQFEQLIWDTLGGWLNTNGAILESAQKDSAYDPLARWFFLWIDHARELFELIQIPNVQDRYVLLQSWRDRYQEIQSVAATISEDNISPMELGDRSQSASSKCTKLTALLLKLCATELAKLSSNVTFAATVQPAIINAGQPRQVEIEARNEGPLPLRHIAMSTVPIDSREHVPYLAPGASVRWNLDIPAQPAGSIALSLNWSAQRVDGQRVDGVVELPLEARSLRIANLGDEFGVSPYVVGSPIETPEMFYGREDILNKIRLALRTVGPSNVILLEGNRRAGKSSILQQLLQPTVMPDWIPAYCSFQSVQGDESKAGMHSKDLFYSIARELSLAVHKVGAKLELPGIGDISADQSRLQLRISLTNQLKPLFETEPFELLQIVIESLFAANPSAKILLMLDEFDKLQESIDSGIMSPQVPENLRYLFHTYPKLSGILSGTHRIQRMRQQYWHALFGIGNRIGVGPLDSIAARDLAAKPVAGRIVFSRSATDKILRLCDCQPYLLQSLCHRVFEQCVERDTHSVGVDIVDLAAEKMVEDNEHFWTLWDSMSTASQKYITCLVNQLSLEHHRVTFDLLLERLANDGIDANSLVEDLNELRQLEIICLTEPSTYSIEVPLFSYWISMHIDMNSCKAEAIKETEEEVGGR